MSRAPRGTAARRGAVAARQRSGRSQRRRPRAQPDSAHPSLIAGVLAQQGIMSLRFDKYFTGRTGAGAYAKDPGRIDLDAFIRQAAAAYHVLGARRETRPEALLVAGHSEGGLYALLTAGARAAAPGRDRADRAHGRAAAQHDRTAGDGPAERGRRRGHARPRRRGRERQRGPARDRRVPCRAAGGHQRAAARRRAQAQAGAARRGERAVRAPGGRRAIRWRRRRRWRPARACSSPRAPGTPASRFPRSSCSRWSWPASGPPDRDCRCWREWTTSCTAQARPATNPCSLPRWSPR